MRHPLKKIIFKSVNILGCSMRPIKTNIQTHEKTLHKL